MDPVYLFAAALLVAPRGAGGDVDSDITELSLEELMNIEVSVASRSQQKLSDAPAAVYVLTGDEIRRAGHHSIQEALRMVPGFLVGHWQSVTWDATSRGFTSVFNHNILVLIDGVNVYTMMGTEGVRWHLQEIDLADVERIEVVRGPGAALWGQNAVNGVINVVTKKCADTHGGAVRTMIGTHEQKLGLRYGAQLDRWGASYRVWSVGSLHDGLSTFDGTGAVVEIDNEDWWVAQGGARFDVPLEHGGTFSLIAKAFDAEREHNYQIDFPDGSAVFEVGETPERGQSVVATWDMPHQDGDLDRISTSFQRVTQDRKDFDTRVDIVDVDWLRRTRFSDWNSLTYGAGWRFVGWEFDGGFSYNYDPETSTNWNVRAFALDEVTLFDGDLRIVGGAELENNDLTGTEVQPTLRSIYGAGRSISIWGAASRAVRTPSLVESYDYSQFHDPSEPRDYVFKGNEDLDSEEVYAYELGLRLKPHEKFSVDAVAFYNDLDDIVTNETIDTPAVPPANANTTFTYDNFGAAEAWGFELAVDAVITEDWRLRGAVTHFEQNNELDSRSNDALFELNDNLFPENIANLRSYFDLGSDWELDLALYFVDPIREYGTPSYLRTDLRVGYNPSPNLRFSIGVQNADDPEHPEDGGALLERSFWFGLTWSE